MTLRRTLLLACLLLLLPWSAFAKNEPVTYTIKKGDTLWGISQRFLKDPYYWPNLWANNPKLPNPHFIYPGQQVKIYDGRIEIVPAPTPASQPETVAAVGEAMPPQPAEPEVTVKVLGDDQGFLSRKQLFGSGTVLDTVDNRMMITRGDTVYMQMNDVTNVNPGVVLSLFQQGDVIKHPVTGETIGYRITNLGTLRVTSVNAQIVSGVVTSALREIQRGARVLPYQEPLRTVTLRKTDRDLHGYLVAGVSNQIALGQFDVIYLNLGSADGLEVGNMVNISRPRKATDLALQKKDLQLPEVLLGNAVVLKTEATTATALILKSALPIYRGDRVSTMVP